MLARDPFRLRISRFLRRVAVVAASTVVLIAAFAISIALFAVALVVILMFGGYLWWRTRDLRKQMRSAQRGGNIIEGEVVRDPQPEKSIESEHPTGRR